MQTSRQQPRMVMSGACAVVGSRTGSSVHGLRGQCSDFRGDHHPGRGRGSWQQQLPLSPPSLLLRQNKNKHQRIWTVGVRMCRDRPHRPGHQGSSAVPQSPHPKTPYPPQGTGLAGSEEFLFIKCLERLRAQRKRYTHTGLFLFSLGLEYFVIYKPHTAAAEWFQQVVRTSLAASPSPRPTKRPWL